MVVECSLAQQRYFVKNILEMTINYANMSNRLLLRKKYAEY